MLVVASLLCSTTLAAPPKAEWLFPSGVGPGATTTITASDGGGWPVTVWIDDAQGVTLEAHKDNGKFVITTAADVQPGLRWVRFYNDEGASSLRPLFIGTLPELEEKEPNDGASQAQEVGEKIVVNGVLQKREDVDGYRVTLKRGQTLVASLTANQVLESPMDAVIQVCDTRGFVITQNHDTHGLDPQVAFTAPRDDAFIVRVFAFPSQPDSSISFAGAATYVYRLTLTTGAFVDHAMPLAVSGASSEVALHGWNLPAELTRMTLSAPGGAGEVVVRHPLLANTIALPVVGDPIVVASEAGAKSQAVSVPVVISGRIEAEQGGRGHSFAFAAKKGQTLRVRVESESIGYALDPVLRITDAAGKEISESDDAKGLERRDPSIDFKPPADGDYVVTVRDLTGRGGFRSVYRLTIEEPHADFALTLEKDTFVVGAGKTVELPVTIDRQGGFEGEISVSAEGLPEGAEAKAVVSNAKDATAKAVKLVIKGPASPWSGPVRIVASSGDAKRTATFAAGGQRHEHVWLTVTK